MHCMQARATGSEVKRAVPLLHELPWQPQHKSSVGMQLSEQAENYM